MSTAGLRGGDGRGGRGGSSARSGYRRQSPRQGCLGRVPGGCVDARLTGIRILIAIFDAPASGRVLVGEGLDEDKFAEDEAAFVVAFQEKESIDDVVRHEHFQVEGEADRLGRFDALAGIEEEREQKRALAAVGRTPGAFGAGEQFIIGAEDGRVLPDFAPGHLPLAAAHAGRDFKLIRGLDGLPFLVSLLHLDRQGDVVNIENAIDAQGAKQKAGEVLEALFRVHDAVVAGVAAVDEGARRGDVAAVGAGPMGGRVLDPHQSVAGRPDGPTRNAAHGGVVAGIGADQVEDPFRGEVLHDETSSPGGRPR
jgi:hypothetical protein